MVKPFKDVLIGDELPIFNDNGRLVTVVDKITMVQSGEITVILSNGKEVKGTAETTLTVLPLDS